MTKRLTNLLTLLASLHPATKENHPGIGAGMLNGLINEAKALLAEPPETDEQREDLTQAFKDGFWSATTPITLHQFGAAVLEIMANEPEWDANLLDRIAQEAFDRNLAHLDDDDMFADGPDTDLQN